MTSVAKYSTRTCSRCGIKKPANRIYSKTVEKSYTGSSRRSINAMTWIGVLLGNKGATRATEQYLFQSSNRKYGGSTTKQISLCSQCFHRVPAIKSKVPLLFKLFFFPFFLFYITAKFLLTSPLIRELVIYIFGIVVWLTIKLLKMLRFLGIKILDQDGDGDLDKKDLEIAYQKVESFFSRFKKKKDKKTSEDEQI